MSEEKLYAVRNDEGLLLSYSEQGAPLWRVWGEMLADKPTAEITARVENGHVVTLIEEPKKVVVSEEEAEMLRMAKTSGHPYGYIYAHTHTAVNEDRLMRAYVNGYTLAKEKKYNLVLGTNGSDKYTCSTLVKETSVEGNIFLFINPVTIPNDLTVPQYQFTQSEIDKYNDDFWIKGIDLNDYKVEVEE